MPFVRGLPSVARWTPRKWHVCRKTCIHVLRFTVGKGFACIHANRRKVVKRQSKHQTAHLNILNKIINAPCGTLKLLLALGVAKYIKSYKIHFVVQYATDYCPLEHDNYKAISAHLGSPISCYINNLHGPLYFCSV